MMSPRRPVRDRLQEITARTVDLSERYEGATEVVTSTTTQLEEVEIESERALRVRARTLSEIPRRHDHVVCGGAPAVGPTHRESRRRWFKIRISGDDRVPSPARLHDAGDPAPGAFARGPDLVQRRQRTDQVTCPDRVRRQRREPCYRATAKPYQGPRGPVQNRASPAQNMGFHRLTQTLGNFRIPLGSLFSPTISRG
jgi:hypothetical protein